VGTPFRPRDLVRRPPIRLAGVIAELVGALASGPPAVVGTGEEIAERRAR
jgi:hypothetical protein